MSEENPEGGNHSGETPAADSFKPITTQDALNEAIKDRLNREREKFKDYSDLKAKAAKLDEIEESQRSAEERATAALQAAETRAAEAESRALRLEVASEKGLTPAQARRLVGSTREELESDADELLETFKPTETPTEKPTVDLDLGTRPGAPSPSDPRMADLAQIESDLKAAKRP